MCSAHLACDRVHLQAALALTLSTLMFLAASGRGSWLRARPLSGSEPFHIRYISFMKTLGGVCNYSFGNWLAD
jgi:hypothetical protein